MNLDKAMEIYGGCTNFSASPLGIQAILDAIEKEQQSSEATPDVACEPNCTCDHAASRGVQWEHAPAPDPKPRYTAEQIRSAVENVLQHSTRPRTAVEVTAAVYVELTKPKPKTPEERVTTEDSVVYLDGRAQWRFSFKRDADRYVAGLLAELKDVEK